MRAVRRRRPDICLVDARIAGGGVAAVRELAAVAPETPIVMLLESAAEEELLAALRAGASGCLLKDIEPIALGRAVRATLDGEGSLPRGFVACVIEELRCRSRELRVKHREGHVGDAHQREAEVLQLMHRRLTTQQIADASASPR